MSYEGYDWDAVLQSRRFQTIARRRRTTIIVLGLLAGAYYFAIPAVIAWYPQLFKLRVSGGFTLGVLFAISQYLFGGLVVWVFMRRMRALDLERDVLVVERRPVAGNREVRNAV
ncbi:DUF485 domain-containing protein [Burkholderia gladioli]|uniref:DUF485 domain-containing protein n=1 Tax=Burkholderia gladioli TaxID=28095 RepID=UPI000F54119A|nr:DUF485 domain-containing protein [Burkholderia gladioli]